MIYIQKMKTPKKIKDTMDNIIVNPVNRFSEIMLPNDSEHLRNLFDDLMPKQDIREALYKEQHGLCAYCMRRIEPHKVAAKADKEADYIRIEHYVPLSLDKRKALDYQNFLGVCFGGEKDDNEGSFCCDKSRGDIELTIDPHNQRQMKAIAYHKDGRVVVRDDVGLDPILVKKMKQDIDHVLCLNGSVDLVTDALKQDTRSHLRLNRKKIYDSISSEFEMLEKKKRLSSDHIKERIDYLNRLLTSGQPALPYIGVRLYRYQRMYDKLKKLGK